MRLIFSVVAIYGIAITNTYGRTIYIRTQKEFEELGVKLKQEINTTNKKVVLDLKKGTYYYKKNHIWLNKQNTHNLTIEIRGNGSVLIPHGKEYENSSLFEVPFSPECSIVDVNNLLPLIYWSRAYRCNSRVEIVKKQENLWRVKCSALPNVTKQQSCHTFFLLSCWFKSFIIKVDHIKDGYLYFYSDNYCYNRSYNCYELDYDYGYGKQYARIKLCNSVINKGIRFYNNVVCIDQKGILALVCKDGTFFKIEDSKLRTIEIQGCKFLGSSLSNGQESLIDIRNTDVKSVKIVQNLFKGIQTNAINIVRTANVTIKENVFEDCYRTCIYSDNLSTNTRAIGNFFNHCGLRLNNDYCVYVQGYNYYIGGNTFRNFGYCAIRVGVWHRDKKICPSNGIVEKNEIYYTSSYLKDIDEYALMDSGAIYIATQNDDATIRYNYIHDIGGIKDNRGIFCDDGARNFSIYGNIIIHINNSYCIDSPRRASVETVVGPANTCNVIRDNIVDGRIRFEGHEKKCNGCSMGTTFYLTSDESNPPKSIIRNVEVNGEEKVLKSIGVKKDIIELSCKSYEQLKKNTELKWGKRYFVKKMRDS